MSADNGYTIRNHPDGGFTPVHYFESDDYARAVTGEDKSYPSIGEAIRAVENEWTEYGISLHSEVRR